MESGFIKRGFVIYSLAVCFSEIGPVLCKSGQIHADMTTDSGGALKKEIKPSARVQSPL